MNTWAAKIEEFAKPAHKNIAIFIPESTSEEIKRVLDKIAKDAQWTYKEIKEKHGKQVLSYQKTRLRSPLNEFTDIQIIECTFIPKDNGVHIDIESRFFAPLSISGLLFYNPHSYRINFFDFFGRNRKNLEYIISSLKKTFPNITTVKATNNDSNMDAAHKKISITTLIYALLKICILLIVLLAICLTFLMFILAVQMYNHHILDYRSFIPRS